MRLIKNEEGKTIAAFDIQQEGSLLTNFLDNLEMTKARRCALVAEAIKLKKLVEENDVRLNAEIRESRDLIWGPIERALAPFGGAALNLNWNPETSQIEVDDGVLATPQAVQEHVCGCPDCRMRRATASLQQSLKEFYETITEIRREGSGEDDLIDLN